MSNSKNFPVDRKTAFQRYKQLRTVASELTQSTLLKKLPKGALLDCAKKLGMAQGKYLTIEYEDELAILFDYCLFTYRVGGKNVIERYLMTNPPPPNSDEMQILKAKSQAWYSVFRAEHVEKGYGVVLRDLIRDKEYVLMDQGMGSSAKPTMIFAGRLICFADFCMTSGTFLPIADPRLRSEVEGLIRKLFMNRGDKIKDGLPSGVEASFSAQVIRAALRAGVLKKMRYQEIK